MYNKYFQEDLVKALESLQVFPLVIKDCRDFLKQRYLKKHKRSELVWIDKLSGEYKDNCQHYAEFIKRIVAIEFLAKCLNIKENEVNELISRLKANINAANKRLNNFLGETDRKEVVGKLDAELAKMESSQQKADKKQKYAFKFSEFIKGKVLEHVGEIFAKVVGPLWEMIFTNATSAIQSDYDHQVLVDAINHIQTAMPEMEKSLDQNRRALKAVDDVLETLKQQDGSKIKEILLGLYPVQNDIINTCDNVIKLVNELE